MNKIYILLVIFCIIFTTLISLKIIVYRIAPFIGQYALTWELDLPNRYGKNSWVLITGPSSGMGERFAHEFANRGFNLLLVGSKRTKLVIADITRKHKDIGIRFIEKDFSETYFNEYFFDDIQKEVDNLGSKWTILINNVGYRTGHKDYREMPINEIKKTVAVGTIVQAKLIQMALQKFAKRKTHTAIISITAKGSINTDLFALDNDITVPHLAAYEATNAWGYYHAKSVYAEIKNKFPLIDFLIITPGAVLTKNTDSVLHNTAFAVDVETYIKNVIKLMGNYQGPMCAYYGHSFSDALINIVPWFDKETIMKEVGINFANNLSN
jgi:short-subunit dehydrogenase